MDRSSLTIPLSEVVPCEHLRKGFLAHKSNDLIQAHRFEPVRLPPDVGPFLVKDFPYLLKVRCGILLDLCLMQWRPGFVLAGWIADLSRGIADYEDGVMSEVLEPPKRPQHNRVSQMDVWLGWIQPE